MEINNIQKNNLDKDKENEITIETCDICAEIHNNESINLKCGHKYHYQCILKTFIIREIRECPYCRRESDFLEFNSKYEGPIKNIHFTKNNLYENNLFCCAIIKSGFNSGKKCNNFSLININNKNYCGIHKKYGNY